MECPHCHALVTREMLHCMRCGQLLPKHAIDRTAVQPQVTPHLTEIVGGEMPTAGDPDDEALGAIPVGLPFSPNPSIAHAPSPAHLAQAAGRGLLFTVGGTAFGLATVAVVLSGIVLVNHPTPSNRPMLPAHTTTQTLTAVATTTNLVTRIPGNAITPGITVTPGGPLQPITTPGQNLTPTTTISPVSSPRPYASPSPVAKSSPLPTPCASFGAGSSTCS